MKKIVIGTRGSILALAQAEKVKEIYEDDDNCKLSMIGLLDTNEFNGKKSVQLTSQFLSVERMEE